MRDKIKERWAINGIKKSKNPPKYEKQIKSFNSEKSNECLEEDIADFNIPITDEKEWNTINYLNKIYKITAQDARIIYHAFDGDISYKKLGELYKNFKKHYSPIEIAVVLELFKNDINKVRYTIAVNRTQNKKTLESTALQVKEEKDLDEYSRLIKKLRQEEPKKIYELDEMSDGRVSEDGEKFMRCFFREQREDEKLVNKHKGMNLEKALRYAGMHIIH